MDRQKVLNKVSKLLALANDCGASPNEAETALRQARHLMKQYNLESLEVAAHAVEEVCVPTAPLARLKTGCTVLRRPVPMPSIVST